MGIIVVTALYTFTKVRPYELSPEQLTIRQAVDWYHGENFAGRYTLFSHTWIPHFAEDISPEDVSHISSYAAINLTNLDTAPVGTIVIWDSHYSHRLNLQVPLTALRGNPAYKLVKHFQTP